MEIIPKLQKGNYIAQQDAIRNYKPKQPQEKYAIPTKQPTISQDNRSSWQKQQSQSKAQQGHKDYMESKQTQKGLHNLNGFLNFTDYVGLATGAGSLISSGVKYAGKQAAKKLVKRNVIKDMTNGEDYTNRLIKALGDKKDLTPNSTPKYTSYNKKLLWFLESLGVDVSKFTDGDLTRLRFLRTQSVKQNPPISGRFVTIEDTPLINENVFTADLYNASKPKQRIGYINGSSQYNIDNNLHAGFIEKINKEEKGISEDLYNAVIRYGKESGYDGLVSGERLVSPEITYKIWEHYPNKRLMNNTGKHQFNTGESVRNSNYPKRVISDGAVYDLVEPSRYIPTKHIDLFNPSIINPTTGKLNPPDWGNPSIYKLLAPGISGASGMFNRKQE